MMVCLVLVLGTAAHRRNLVWKNELSLWSDVVKKSPSKDRPHDYMGIACFKSGLIEIAFPIIGASGCVGSVMSTLR